jgi:hypothetical protein
MKAMLQILLEEISIPFFVLWKWTEDDYKKGLSVKIGDWTAVFYFVPAKFSTGLPDRQFPMYANILFSIPNPSAEFLEGLKNSNRANAITTAESIHDAYRKCLKMLISLSRWTIDLSSITEGGGDGLQEMLKGWTSILDQTHVFWRIDSGDFTPFEPQLPKRRGINPLFKSKNLLTVSKWTKVIESGRKGVIVNDQLNELLRIQAKARWGENRIPTIETAALMEVTIRNKVQLLLHRQGQSKKKIDAADDELGFSMLLNVFLPIALTKGELAKYKKYIDDLDALRRVRNNIMHRNISESSIDHALITRGIKAAIKITEFLDRKFRKMQ